MKRLLLLSIFASLLILSCDRLNDLFLADLYSTVEDANGNGSGLIVAGQFTTINGLAQVNIARIDSEGEPAGEFTPVVDGIVRSVVIVERDGRSVAVIGGDFATVNGISSPGVAMVDMKGRLVESFDAALTDSGGTLDVYSILPAGNGDLILGGEFGGPGGDGVYDFLARVRASDGSLVTTFAPDPDGVVYDIATGVENDLLADRYVVVGAFTTIGGETSYSVASVDDNGVVVSVSEDMIPSYVQTVAVDRDEKSYYFGGDLSGFYVSEAVERVGPLTSGDAGYEFSFYLNYPYPDGLVEAIAPRPYGGYLVGGSFLSVAASDGSWSQSYLYAVSYSDNSNDSEINTNFLPVLDGPVRVIRRDGETTYVAGSFTTWYDSLSVTEEIATGIVRLNDQLEGERDYSVIIDDAGLAGKVYDLATIVELE